MVHRIEGIRNQQWFKELQDWITTDLAQKFQNILENEDVDYNEANFRVILSKRVGHVKILYPTSLGQKSEDIKFVVKDGVS